MWAGLGVKKPAQAVRLAGEARRGAGQGGLWCAGKDLNPQPPIHAIALYPVELPALKIKMVAGASPALVSSLLIRSDQLRRSMFGFRSARSTLAAQWSTLRFVVQLSYRSSFASLRFAARSPSSLLAANVATISNLAQAR